MRFHVPLKLSKSRNLKITITTLTLCTLLLIGYNYTHLLLPANLNIGETPVKVMKELPFQNTSTTNLYHDKRKGNDVLLTLVRNTEIDQIERTIENFENNFNSKYHYDWWFMNDEDFTQEFQERVENAVSGRTKFIKIPKELWSYPDYIDRKKADASRKAYGNTNIMYGDSESYRFMCRFNSGMFYKIPELEHIEYYWRIEPGTKFNCEITYDVFQYMRKYNKLYAFNMALQEDVRTIPTLWNATMEFLEKNPHAISKNNLAGFVSDDHSKSYNLCHFWSNFEIASTEFFKSPVYETYFDFLDHKGGFFYERWGDAPVHTLAVSLMLPANRIHFVANTGYYHKPNRDCPPNDELRDALHCQCNPRNDFTWHKYSCVHKFFSLQNLVRPDSLEHISMVYPTIFDTIMNPTN